MDKLTRTQLSVLASYSSPFILLVAVAINTFLVSKGILNGPLRLLLLSSAFPIGLGIGRLIYLRRSHIEILFDSVTFQVTRGRREIAAGSWRSYGTVSIVLDRYERPNVRLYKTNTKDEDDYVDLPIFGTNAKPQEFRDYVIRHLRSGTQVEPTLQVVEAS